MFLFISVNFLFCVCINYEFVASFAFYSLSLSSHSHFSPWSSRLFLVQVGSWYLCECELYYGFICFEFSEWNGRMEAKCETVFSLLSTVGKLTLKTWMENHLYTHWINKIIFLKEYLKIVRKILEKIKRKKEIEVFFGKICNQYFGSFSVKAQSRRLELFWNIH